MSEDAVSVSSPRHFQAVVKRYDEVLVYFYAPDSEPCREIAPAVGALVEDEVAPVAEVNVEENERVASVYNVNSVPTIVLFNDGDPVSRSVGAKTKDELRRFVED
jgi:thioredoxin 1